MAKCCAYLSAETGCCHSVRALFNEFVEQLSKPDVLILAEIYAARERNTIGISSRDLVEKIPGSIYCATLPEVTQRLQELAQPGDVILFKGSHGMHMELVLEQFLKEER